jgi:protein HOOK3
VWANGNEKVIKKIQGLDEKVMAELMRSIEEVMGSLPETEGDVEEEMGVGMGMGMGVKRRSPVKVDKSDQ